MESNTIAFDAPAKKDYNSYTHYYVYRVFTEKDGVISLEPDLFATYDVLERTCDNIVKIESVKVIR